MQRIFLLLYLFLSLALSTRGWAEENPSRSKITDIGRVIAAPHETQLLLMVNGFEKRTQVAIKIYTSFRLHENYDVKIIFSKEGVDDNTIILVVQTGISSLLTGEYKKDSPDFKDDLFTDRSANLNREGLLPDYMLSEIKRRMANAYYGSKAKDNSTQLYESLHTGVTMLSALIYNPVVIKGSLIPESLWNSDYAFINPEAAGFVDGAYNTLKALPELPNAITQATDLARDLAFNYTLNTDGYRDATNELVVEMATNLDTYIRLAKAIDAGEKKLKNIYHGTTKEDRYYRGIIAFEVVALLVPLAETKAAVKTAQGMRRLLAELKALKLGKVKAESNLARGLSETHPEQFAEFVDEVDNLPGSGKTPVAKAEKEANNLTGIFKSFTQQQLDALEPIIDKAVSKINHRKVSSKFTDLSKSQETIDYMLNKDIFTTGDLVELPAREFFKKSIKGNEEVLLINLSC